MPCGWEGNRRSGNALAMRHRLKWFIHLWAHSLDREMSTPPAPTLSCGVWPVYLYHGTTAPLKNSEKLLTEKLIYLLLKSSSVFTCIGALGTPSWTGPLARKYLPGFPYIYLCKGNKIISLKKFISPQPVGARQKEKNPGALGTCPVCPLVKTALLKSHVQLCIV